MMDRLARYAGLTKIFSQWIKTLFISLLLTACTSPLTPKTNTRLNNQTTECLAMTRQYVMADQLKKRSIQVIQVGDETQLILPVDDYFYTQSNHLRTDKLANLQAIIQFINTYPVVNLTVTGFTDTSGDYTRNLGLSRAQAQRIAQYLWQNGLKARLITANGKACHAAIANNKTAAGRRQNRRLEIYFRLPPPQNVFQ